MKTSLITFAILLIYSTNFISTVIAQNVNYDLKEFKLSVNGTSTLHDWECVSDQIKAETSFKNGTGYINKISRLRVLIPSSSLKSGKKLMNKKMQTALKAGSYPEIEFEIKETINLEKSGSVMVIGDLTIAGITKIISFNLVYDQPNIGDIIFTGSKDLKMTDFQIIPPEVLMGSIKTGDEITIEFQVSFKRKEQNINIIKTK